MTDPPDALRQGEISAMKPPQPQQSAPVMLQSQFFATITLPATLFLALWK